MDSMTSNAPVETELSLRQLIAALLGARWLILASMALAMVVAGIAGTLLPKSFKAVIVILPVTSSPGGGQLGGMGSLLNQFGGLASLAGLAAGSDTKKSESLAVLQSEALTEKYIQQNDLLPVLFWKSWDPRQKKWKETRPDEVPTLWKGNAYFNKSIRTVTTDAKTGLATLTIKWTDPHAAAKWANDLVNITNDYLRRKAIDESQR